MKFSAVTSSLRAAMIAGSMSRWKDSTDLTWGLNGLMDPPKNGAHAAQAITEKSVRRAAKSFLMREDCLR